MGGIKMDLSLALEVQWGINLARMEWKMVLVQLNIKALILFPQEVKYLWNLDHLLLIMGTKWTSLALEHIILISMQLNNTKQLLKLEQSKEMVQVIQLLKQCLVQEHSILTTSSFMIPELPSLDLVKDIILQRVRRMVQDQEHTLFMIEILGQHHLIQS